MQERMFKAHIISDDLGTGIPKTLQELRQDSLAKEKAKADRTKYIEDSIKAAKEKKPSPVKNTKIENLDIKKEDYQE